MRMYEHLMSFCIRLSKTFLPAIRERLMMPTVFLFNIHTFHFWSGIHYNNSELDTLEMSYKKTL